MLSLLMSLIVITGTVDDAIKLYKSIRRWRQRDNKNNNGDNNDDGKALIDKME